MTRPQSIAPKLSASTALRNLAFFMGEQEEREAVVAWLRKTGDGRPSGTDWRAYYEIADAIELGVHRAQPTAPQP